MIEARRIMNTEEFSDLAARLTRIEQALDVLVQQRSVPVDTFPLSAYPKLD